jgi:Calcineurin-like phosphoesterase
LKPGAFFTIAREGTVAAAKADDTYSTSLNFLGTGVWVESKAGKKIDSVGIYHLNEMDSSLDVPSPCTNGISLVTFQPDRILAETYHRVAFTGVDARDFSPAVSSLATEPSPSAKRQSSPDPAAEAHGTAKDGETARVATDLVGEAAFVPLVPTAVWSGFSEGGALTSEKGDGESRIAASIAELPADGITPVLTDTGYRYPYFRFALPERSTKSTGSGTFVAHGKAMPGQEIQLSSWNNDKSVWKQLSVADADADGAFEVSGTIPASAGQHPLVLLQAGPRTEKRFDENANGEFENPANYDLAISHITDTQYLTEAYPELYDNVAKWIVDNAETRKIAFATHTGDMVQNWVDPNQPTDRAILEFERASESEAILDKAGIPNSVLPGNHDSMRGMDETLFNTYFGPDRYAGTAWYQGSIGVGDNSSNFSTFERAGAKFLMLSISYGFGERELKWATKVVESHPDFNVVISTHEHVTPKGVAESPTHSASKRWLSRGDLLWDQVIAPHRNVVLVLSGHYHGVGEIRTEDAGGIPGHSVVELVADYQEFRTETGERATGFQRLLQIDLSAGAVSVNTFSQRLNASASYPYDYMQFLPETGLSNWPANGRPWNIIARGLQNRYDASDDEFVAKVQFEYTKSLSVSAIGYVPDPAETDGSARGSRPQENDFAGRALPSPVF